MTRLWGVGAYSPQLTKAGLIIVDDVVMYTSGGGHGASLNDPTWHLAMYYM